MNRNRVMLFVGDFSSKSGPSTVNRNLISHFGNNIIQINQGINPINRILKIISLIHKSDHILLSGLSKVNIIFFLCKKIFKFKIVYLMHGNVKTENSINGFTNKSWERIENFHLKYSDLIICVSEYFMNVMKNLYKQYEYKFQFANNCTNWTINKSKLIINNNLISTIGGGLKIKGILPICKAIHEINNELNYDLHLQVFGKEGDGIKEIQDYSFVKFYGSVDQETLFHQLKQSKLYIQNSIFETFGLASIEAIQLGCDVLISRNMGCISIIETIKDEDLINDNFNIEEIKHKILGLLNSSNNKRLFNGIDKEKTTCFFQAELIKGLIAKIK